MAALGMSIDVFPRLDGSNEGVDGSRRLASVEYRSDIPDRKCDEDDDRAGHNHVLA
jgi:hypothetical protein